MSFFTLSRVQLNALLEMLYCGFFLSERAKLALGQTRATYIFAYPITQWPYPLSGTSSKTSCSFVSASKAFPLSNRLMASLMMRPTWFSISWMDWDLPGISFAYWAGGFFLNSSSCFWRPAKSLDLELASSLSKSRQWYKSREERGAAIT